jgi:colanic acid/amylovoran biosynthesis glycosyltransferase
LQSSFQKDLTGSGNMRKLNICIVNPNRNAYSETFIRNHIKYLPGNILFVYGGWFPAFDKDDQRIADEYINRSFASKAAVLLCKLLPAFIANKIPSRIKGYPYDEELNGHSFRFILKKNKIDVVLAEFMYKGVMIKDACADLKIPFVVHTHGGADIENKDSLKLYADSISDMFHKASRIISVDSYSSSKLFELGLPKRKLAVIGLGIDLELFKKTKPSSNAPVFLIVGRLVNMKAPYLTILAFASVLKDHPEAKLIIVGTGNLFDCCVQIIKALRIEESVIFPGVLTPEEVSGYMQKSRAFVQHSVHTTDGDSEGLPVAILEAMATGLPVISTYHNGIADTITNEVDGLLMEENDIDTMATYMRKVIEEPFYADELGAKAREKIEQHFEMRKVINQLSSVLQNAVENYKSRDAECKIVDFETAI